MLTGRANDMATKLVNGENSNFLMVDSHEEALQNAQNGGLSLVTYYNPNGGSGHIATYSVGDNATEGAITNIGSKKYTGFVSLNMSISKSKEKHFFILLPNMLKEVVVTPQPQQNE